MYYAMYVCIRSLHMHVLLCTCARICVSNVFEAMRVRILYVRVWTQVYMRADMHACYTGCCGLSQSRCPNYNLERGTWESMLFDSSVPKNIPMQGLLLAICANV